MIRAILIFMAGFCIGVLFGIMLIALVSANGGTKE